MDPRVVSRLAAPFKIENGRGTARHDSPIEGSSDRATQPPQRVPIQDRRMQASRLQMLALLVRGEAEVAANRRHTLAAVLKAAERIDAS